MGVTQSNSGLFSTPGFVVSPVGKKEKWRGEKKKRREGGKKGIEKERKEEEGRERDQRQHKKEF